MTQSLLFGMFLIVSVLTMIKVLYPFLSTPSSNKKEALKKGLTVKLRDGKKHKD